MTYLLQNLYLVLNVFPLRRVVQLVPIIYFHRERSPFPALRQTNRSVRSLPNYPPNPVATDDFEVWLHDFLFRLDSLKSFFLNFFDELLIDFRKEVGIFVLSLGGGVRSEANQHLSLIVRGLLIFFNTYHILLSLL